MVCRSKYAPNTVLIENIPTRFCWLIYRKQKLVQSKILKQEILVLILPCHAKQVLMSILCIIFYLVSEEFSFSATSSKTKIDQENFLLWQQITELY